jgi:hypothetical protein
MNYVPFFWAILKDFYINKREAQSAKKERRVVFGNSGPSGYVIYHDRDKSTKFYTEVGGGSCIFYISIPTEQQWETQTGYPSANRKEILNFIAEEGLKKQARLPGAYFKMNETSIAFYQR